MKRFLVLLTFCCFAQASENSLSLFQEANQSFDKGEYSVAIQKYESLIGQGLDSSELHFNLGNAYFKSGKLGLSIFHYKRALELSPRDPDTKFNLSYAKEKVADQVENHDSFISRLAAISESLNLKETYYLFTVVTFLSLIGSLMCLYKKSEALTLVRNCLLVVVLLVGLVVVHHTFWWDAFGVVTAAETKVYSGVGKDNVVLFALHEGVEFTVADNVGEEWLRIQLSDGKQGWVKADSVVHVTF